jgi:predicted dehydrogenase
MEMVRIGIVGRRVMGSTHAGNILAGKIDRLTLAAVCDSEATKRARFPRPREGVAPLAHETQSDRRPALHGS